MLPQHQMRPPPMDPTSDPLQRQYIAHQPPTGNHGMGYGPSGNLSFPIRTSQHGGPLFTNSPTRAYLNPAEHRLRRKTPNGTIDAAYDASPLQVTHGPPPLKQMALSSSSLLASFSPNAPLQPFSRNPSALDAAPMPVGSPFDGMAAPWSLGHVTEFDPALDVAFHPQPWLHPMGYPQDLAGAPMQPVLRANDINVRAFCPPPMPSNAMLPFGQDWSAMYWQGEGYQAPVPQSATNMSHVPRGNLHRSLSDFASHSHDLWSSQQLPSVASAPHTANATGDGHIGRASHGSQTAILLPQSGFRDKVLAQAHSHYMELLSYAQSSKKHTQTKHDPASRSTTSPFLYPKPPNPTHRLSLTYDMAPPMAPVSSCRSPGNSGFPVQRVGSSFASNPYNVEQSFALPSSGFLGATDIRTMPPNVPPRWFNDSSGMFPAGNGCSPVDNAASSLDVLMSLCEQSGWKWTEGMLLGGCLLYGLERYNEAFEWFSRILNLDRCHVESITNAAAALYCLGRYQEAEQYWLRAIRIRPSYLEAAEHLVGLLYRKRSEDAIEVVTYVQKALQLSSTPRRGNAASSSLIHVAPASKGLGQPRLPSDFIPSLGSHYPHDHQVPGFGSSGYALPGKENGRILALVHAKATMLYGLKDVNSAAETFEEAVLISVGRDLKDVQHLVRYIQAVLLPHEHSGQSRHSKNHSLLQPLLLSPDKARQTARLVFSSSSGELPGLAFIANGSSKRAANQTTSNSLLSLAKIFQDAISHGGTGPHLLRRPPGIGDILALYYLSLSLQESPSTANNVGILLAGVQPELSAQTTQVAGSFNYPTVPGVAPGSGLALALAYYQYGLRLDPKHVHLHTNLGSLLKDIGQLDRAIQMYEQAVSCDGTFDIALTNLANAVKDRGRIQDAITYYKRAVKSNPDFAEAVCGLFTALNSVCDWRGRGGVVLPDSTYDRWHVDEEGILVDAHTRRQASGLTQRVAGIVKHQLHEASQWGLNTLREDVIKDLVDQLHGLYDGERHKLEEAVRRWAGEPWEGSRIIRLVERACRVLQHRCYVDRLAATNQSKDPGSARQLMQSTALEQYRRPRLPASLTVPPAPTVLPFHTFTCPLTASDVRAISQRNAVRISCSTMRSTWLPNYIYPPPHPPKPHLNVGYVSSDFNNHPLAHLMQSVFGFHDPGRVKAYCYATTASDGSSHRLKIESEAPVFRDVSNWPPSRLADQISNDDIHVLVNLNGYTRGARNEIFAARPAPVQMSFMGFAGSLGAEWCDYLLADTTAVPPSTLRPWRSNTELGDVLCDESESSDGNWIYSENVIFCRDTFFCCDHAQSAEVSERDITWAEEEERRWAMRKKLFPNLDDDTIILGNFNQLYKIEPTTFRTWLRILDKVPKAVLWLLRFPEPGEQHLQSTAEAWAGQDVAKRLIFTDVAPKNQHISRARVCDLFLDTPECNAHTTAADVLWSSTPLLTLPRYPYKMCSRMAASILRGALPKTFEGEEAAKDLIASTEEQYEGLAVVLASGLSYDVKTGVGQGKGRLAELRKVLWSGKWTCGLFDTRRWVSDVESAYEEAWRRWVEGEKGDIFL